MPKLKTHTGASKRFKVTKKGKIKRGHAFTGHDIKGRKNAKKKRALRQSGFCDKTNEDNVRLLIPYM